MAGQDAQTYSIAQAAALTGLHKNTIRMKVRAGQIEAEQMTGKFGEEYRISRQALIDVGLLEEDSPPLESQEDQMLVPIPAGPGDGSSLRTALGDLFIRHENAMFRMGYLESELERSRALAADAQSLQEQRHSQEVEIQTLRRQLQEADARLREIEELRAILTEMESETERLRAEVEQYRAAEEQRKRWQFWRR